MVILWDSGLRCVFVMCKLFGKAAPAAAADDIIL